ncbi:MAG: sigma-70 family RNA polymerase sigma factor [Planctomycetota bacterium]|jgi:RNA polymerase sigma factor for flagellar operon FliA
MDRATPRSRAGDPQLQLESSWDAFLKDPASDAGGRAKDWLIGHYMKTHVRRLAERLHNSLPRQVDVDDLVQQGYLGLREALDRYDPERATRFETFSARRITGAMRDYLRSLDPLPRLTRSRYKRLTAVQEDYQKRFGRPPTDEEMREHLDLPARKFTQLVTGHAPAVVSYQATRADVDPADDTDAMEGLPGEDRRTPLSEAECEDLKRWVTRGFSRRDHLIIVLYYYEHMTMREVGRSLGISESRVSQRLDSIVDCLRSRLSYGGAAEEFV